MGQLVFQATAGGQVALVGPNPSTNFSLNVPAVNGNLVTTGDTGTVTNTMLAASAYNTPGAIGSGTANTGAFTTLSASSTVSGTGFSTYLASPPAIGGTTPSTGKFTTITGTLDASISGLTVGKGGGSVSGSTVVGYQAGTSNVTGAITAFGYQALYSNNTSSGLNLGVGYQAGYSITTGTDNVAVGSYHALYNTTTGSANVAIGREALQANTTASNNTAVGYQAGYSNTTGANNQIFGYTAGYGITTGSGNTIFGYAAGNGSVTTTTGTQNTLIGIGASTSAVGDNYELVLTTYSVAGKGSSTGFIGVGSAGAGSIYQGNNSTLWAITSDQRLKKNIVDNTVGLDAITKIQVRNFEYRTADEVTDLPKENAVNIQGVQIGPIAQELAQVLPDCVKTESTGVMSVDASNITWHLINAVKELNAKVTALEAKLGA